MRYVYCHLHNSGLHEEFCRDCARDQIGAAPAFMGREYHQKIDQKISLGQEFERVSDMSRYLKEHNWTPVSSQREARQIRDTLKMPENKITEKELREIVCQ